MDGKQASGLHCTHHVAQWRKIGSPLRPIAELEALRNAPARDSFCTLAEVHSLMSPEFEFLDAALPRCKLGERRPIASFRRVEVAHPDLEKPPR